MATPKTAYVYPKEAVAIGWEGGVVSLRPAEIWASDDPLVVARPELFGSEPAGLLVRSTSQKKAQPAPEQTTAAPGEKRTTTRAK